MSKSTSEAAPPATRTGWPAAVHCAILLAVVAAVAYLVDWSQFERVLTDKKTLSDLFPPFLVAFVNTGVYTVLAVLAGGVFSAALIAMLESAFAPYRWLARAYLRVVGALPPLFVLLLVIYGVPAAFGDSLPGTDLAGPYVEVTIALGSVAAVYLTPVLRAELPSRDDAPGARLTARLRTASRRARPAVIERVAQLAKDSALAYVLHVSFLTIELSRMARESAVETSSVVPLLIAAMAYLAVVWPLQRWARRSATRSDAAPAKEPHAA
ncbi:MAG: hypothetical protein ACRDXX_15100 [Stackebrandtia sp.]